jgi:hypothetical protein
MNIEQWEEVASGLMRVRIPGGWMYRSMINGHAASLQFVAIGKKTVYDAETTSDEISKAD